MGFMFCLRRALERLPWFAGGPRLFTDSFVSRSYQRIGNHERFTRQTLELDRFIRAGIQQPENDQSISGDAGIDSHFASLPDRSSKRQGPLVPVLAGGNA
jgi:hypothetical protein